MRSKTKHQNPLHFGYITNNAEIKAKEKYRKMFDNSLEQFERNAMRSNSSIKRFPGNTSIHSRSRSLSRPKITAGPGPRIKPKPKPRKRTKKGPTKPTTKPKPRPRTITRLITQNSLSPLILANKKPNTPIIKSPMASSKSNLSLLDTVLKPMPTNKNQTKSKTKSKTKVSNLGIAF